MWVGWVVFGFFNLKCSLALLSNECLWDYYIFLGLAAAQQVSFMLDGVGCAWDTFVGYRVKSRIPNMSPTICILGCSQSYLLCTFVIEYRFESAVCDKCIVFIAHLPFLISYFTIFILF